MNIIHHLQSNENYLQFCNLVLSTNFNTIDIDCSKGETDRIFIIYLPKGNFSFNEAMSMLTLKQKMLNEEWEDVELYDANDVKLWSSMIAKEYASSIYYDNISVEKFLQDDIVKRLEKVDKQYLIFANDSQIDFMQLQQINPCKKDIIKICKSEYARLELEYYLETHQNFVLFNWYTTA